MDRMRTPWVKKGAEGCRCPCSEETGGSCGVGATLNVATCLGNRYRAKREAAASGCSVGISGWQVRVRLLLTPAPT